MNVTNRMVKAIVIICGFTVSAKAECNIGDILFGQVAIEILPHREPSYYETGIIIGDDKNDGPFKSRKILGQIEESERDGSRAIYNAAYDFCGILYQDGHFDATDADCVSCKIPQFSVRKSRGSLIVLSKEGRVIGIIKGRLSM